MVVIRDPAAPETERVAIEEIQLAEIWEGELILIKRAFAATDEQQPFGMAWLMGQVLRERKLFRDIGLRRAGQHDLRDRAAVHVQGRDRSRAGQPLLPDAQRRSRRDRLMMIIEMIVGHLRRVS